MNVPTSNPTWPLNSLVPPVPSGLGASSLNEHRPGNPLLYVCWGLHISWCMLPGWWSSIWEILGVQVNWDCWSSYRDALLLSFFQFSPNSTTGVSSFCPLVRCKYLHLTQLLVGIRNFLTEALKARKAWTNVLWTLRDHRCQPRVLYPAKLLTIPSKTFNYHRWRK
jgi:hypothetical protein